MGAEKHFARRRRRRSALHRPRVRWADHGHVLEAWRWGLEPGLVDGLATLGDGLEKKYCIESPHSIGLTDERKAHLVEVVKHLDRDLPVHTSVGDRHTVLETLWALGGNILPAPVDIRLDHHTGDVPVAGNELLADVVEDLGLIVVVLR